MVYKTDKFACEVKAEWDASLRFKTRNNYITSAGAARNGECLSDKSNYFEWKSCDDALSLVEWVNGDQLSVKGKGRLEVKSDDGSLYFNDAKPNGMKFKRLNPGRGEFAL